MTSVFSRDSSQSISNEHVPSYGYMSAMRKYFQVSGRAPRREFWMFVFIYIIMGIVGEFLHWVFSSFIYDFGINVISVSIDVLHIVPSITVTVRRLQDMNMSWRWVLPFIAIFGGGYIVFAILESGTGSDGNAPGSITMYVVLILAYFAALIFYIVLMARKSDSGDNSYGPHPYRHGSTVSASKGGIG